MEDCGKNVGASLADTLFISINLRSGFTGAFVYSRGIPLRVPSGRWVGMPCRP